MQAFVAFLLIAVLVGGSRAGARVRRRPSMLLAFAVLIGMSMYSLRVVL